MKPFGVTAFLIVMGGIIAVLVTLICPGH